MFSGVSSLRVHQTRMDVIANNIANVNTVGFKSQRATFQDAFYQRIQGASGPDPLTGRAGTNPQQIGLGLNLGSIDNIMTQGASQRTDNPLDLMLTSAGFFIVDTPAGRAFTRAGNVNMDREFNLHINGMTLMGWSAREIDGRFEVDRGTLAPLSLARVQTMSAAPTSMVELVGNLNGEDLELDSTHTGNPAAGVSVPIVRTLTIFDSLGTAWTVDVELRFHQNQSSAATSGFSFWTYEFVTQLATAENGDFILTLNPDGSPATFAPGNAAPPANAMRLVAAWQNNERTDADGDPIQPGFLNFEPGSVQYDPTQTPPAGTREIGGMVGVLAFDRRGNLVSVGGPDQVLNSVAQGAGPVIGGTAIVIDESTLSDMGTEHNVGQVTTLPPEASTGWTFGLQPVARINPSANFGREETPGAIRVMDVRTQALRQTADNLTLRTSPVNGNRPGRLADISVGGDGTISGRYTNGLVRVIGQVPIALFDNPAGLERAGANLWFETQNSGFFDGTGAVGEMQGGALEMSNVDLAAEFTDMITTQRGFQAASRTITVSDEMLQELVNLKR